jgi:osmotically-inducible protein OsmY
MDAMRSGVQTSRIEEELERRAGINAVVEEQDGRIILTGRVATAEQKQAAQDIAEELAGEAEVDNDLDVEETTPVETSHFYAGIDPSASLPDDVEEIQLADSQIEPDYAEARSSTTTLEWSGVDTDEESDTVYMPPTDPVVTTDEKDNVQVLGGFSATSMDSIEVQPSASDDEYGDEAIRDAVVQELREDALTTNLGLEVAVIRGIVFLRGSVTDIDDAENAEEVASRVPGVREVRDETTVATL